MSVPDYFPVQVPSIDLPRVMRLVAAEQNVPLPDSHGSPFDTSNMNAPRADIGPAHDMRDVNWYGSELPRGSFVVGTFTVGLDGGGDVLAVATTADGGTSRELQRFIIASRNSPNTISWSRRVEVLGLRRFVGALRLLDLAFPLIAQVHGVVAVEAANDLERLEQPGESGLLTGLVQAYRPLPERHGNEQAFVDMSLLPDRNIRVSLPSAYPDGPSTINFSQLRQVGGRQPAPNHPMPGDTIHVRVRREPTGELRSLGKAHLITMSPDRVDAALAKFPAFEKVTEVVQNGTRAEVRRALGAYYESLYSVTEDGMATLSIESGQEGALMSAMRQNPGLQDKTEWPAVTFGFFNDITISELKCLVDMLGSDAFSMTRKELAVTLDPIIVGQADPPEASAHRLARAIYRYADAETVAPKVLDDFCLNYLSRQESTQAYDEFATDLFVATLSCRAIVAPANTRRFLTFCDRMVRGDKVSLKLLDSMLVALEEGMKEACLEPSDGLVDPDHVQMYLGVLPNILDKFADVYSGGYPISPVARLEHDLAELRSRQR